MFSCFSWGVVGFGGGVEGVVSVEGDVEGDVEYCFGMRKGSVEASGRRGC